MQNLDFDKALKMLAKSSSESVAFANEAARAGVDANRYLRAQKELIDVVQFLLEELAELKRKV